MKTLAKDKINKIERRHSNQEVAKKKIEVAVLTFLTVILICLTIALAFIYDIGGIRSIAFNQVENRQEEFQKDVNKDNENLFASQQARLDERKKQLEKLEMELNAKSSELAKKEEELKRLIEEAETSKKAIEEKKNDIQSVVKTFENMNSEDAAKILMQYQDKNKVVEIIKKLNYTKSAEILSSMTPSFAAELLQLMDKE